MEQEINASLSRMMDSLGESQKRLRKSKFISGCASLYCAGFVVINAINLWADYPRPTFTAIQATAVVTLSICFYMNFNLWRRAKRSIKNIDALAVNTEGLAKSLLFSTKWEHHMDQLEAALHQKI